MYRKYTVSVHVHNLHPGAINLHHLDSRSKFAPGANSYNTVHMGKFAPRVQICIRVQIAHMNTAGDEVGRHLPISYIPSDRQGAI